VIILTNQLINPSQDEQNLGKSWLKNERNSHSFQEVDQGENTELCNPSVLYSKKNLKHTALQKAKIKA
jgi:hypothetical protein